MMLGTLNLPLWRGKHYLVAGGPYTEKPKGLVGVKMAEERPLFRNGDHEIDIPTQDFSTPPLHEMRVGLIDAVAAITRGDLVYAGCMAGKGRTGLFLAVLAKAFGVKDPVAYVRANYYPHAVETNDQRAFVKDFEIPFEVKTDVFRAKVKSLFRSKTRLTREAEWL